MAPCCLIGALVLALIGLVTTGVRRLLGAPAAREPIWDRPRRGVGHTAPPERESAIEVASSASVAAPVRIPGRWLPAAVSLGLGSLVVLAAVGVFASWHAAAHTTTHAEGVSRDVQLSGAWCFFTPPRSGAIVSARLEERLGR
jgi:hypothetical protein